MLELTFNLRRMLLSLTFGTCIAFWVSSSGEAMNELPIARSAIVDGSLTAARRDAMELAARRYYAFWDTGDESFAKLALAPDFVDRTLPPGRPQGPSGPVLASRTFRTAVPDLRVEVAEMMLVGDRVIGRLRFTGHYTGSFNGKTGDGRAIDFAAIDIYRVKGGSIVENWHLEDNLTLLKQLGAIMN